MEQNSTATPEASLFDGAEWFDPIETGVRDLRRVARGIAAPRSLRTGRDTLASSGSHHPAAGPRVQWAIMEGLRRLSERSQPQAANLRRRNLKQNGFALSMAIIPLRVVTGIEPDDGAPSVQFHYRTFNPTTGTSAPVPRIGTQTLTATGRLGRSLSIGMTGSCVPYRSHDTNRAYETEVVNDGHILDFVKRVLRLTRH